MQGIAGQLMEYPPVICEPTKHEKQVVRKENRVLRPSNKNEVFLAPAPPPFSLLFTIQKKKSKNPPKKPVIYIFFK